MQRGRIVSLIFLFLVCTLIHPPAACPEEGVLRWGGDSEGGFPYMFPDPQNPEKLIGFEVDIVDALAEKMGKKPVYVNNAWDNLIPGLNRNLYDIAINGLEVTPEHEEAVLFSIPYYKTFLQLAIRRGEKEIREFEDLKGKTVGTLKESYAQMILEELGDVNIRTYIVEANTYKDLQYGRLDAALFDAPIALYSAGFNPEIKFVGKPIGEITYAIAVNKNNPKLHKEVNAALVALRDSGELRKIYDRWNLWSPIMAKEFNDYTPRRVEMNHWDEWAKSQRSEASLQKRAARYIAAMPAFAKAAVVTMQVSCMGMLIAITLGLALAIARVFAPVWIGWFAFLYIELMRGTPVLIQLFFVFYGLPSIGIKLTPFWAGALTLGMNYAAYEAEIYRSGLFAIPRTQWEAALALGMTRWQAMRQVILPQAFRVVIPPITNEFLSLLKDSSLVSIITMVDLTKAYGQISATYYDYFGPGIIVATIYLLLGLPFVKFSRYTERRLSEQDTEGGKKDAPQGNYYRSSTRWH